MPLIITLGMVVIIIIFIKLKLNKKETSHIKAQHIDVKKQADVIEAKTEINDLDKQEFIQYSNVSVDIKEENIILEEENKVKKIQKKKSKKSKNK